MTPNGTVFSVIHGLAQEFQGQSKTLPAQTDFMPLTAVLCFTVQGVELVVPLEELAEVRELPAFTRLPRVKPWLIGVASIRGKLVPIVDLVKFMGGGIPLDSKSQRLLVLTLESGFIGVLVDSVAGVRRFETERFYEHATDVPRSFERYVRGCFVDDDGHEKYLFRPLQLVEDELFRDMAV